MLKSFAKFNNIIQTFLTKYINIYNKEKAI